MKPFTTSVARIREVTQTMIASRERRGFVYSPGVVDRICTAVCQKSPFRSYDAFIDAFERAFMSEEQQVANNTVGILQLQQQIDAISHNRRVFGLDV
jgi:hypothetical protein